MTRRRPARLPRRDGTVALINVVFLMLIFFLVAGRIAPPTPEGLHLVRLSGQDPATPPDRLAVLADGRMLWQGEPADVAAYAASLVPPAIARLLPDRDLPAADLLRIARDLRQAGVAEVRIVAEQAPQ